MATNDEPRGPGLTFLGKFISLLLVVGLIGLGVWLVMKPGGKSADKSGSSRTDATAQQQGPSNAPRTGAALPALDAMQESVPRLAAAQTYTPKDNVVDIELSEYFGYAGLIVANGGLEPNDNSFFAKNYGFKLRIKLSEEESWSALNSGKMAASATTADVLAVYGRQFDVVVPAQIGFSRGADGVVVRQDIGRINNLKGQTLVTSQFTEAEFFIRYLAQEAGLQVNLLSSSTAAPSPDAVNLLFAEDAFVAGDVFAEHLSKGGNQLAGCVTWAPKTTEVADGSEGKAKILTTNRNLLIVADILIVNRGFANANPKMMQGLVDGLLWGNNQVRTNPDANLPTIVAAFNTKYPKVDDPDRYTNASAKEELSRVHLSNLPENMAFFSGAIDSAGSFDGIYQSAVLAYKDMISNPADSKRFLNLTHLQGLQSAGKYADQKIEIAPVRLAAAGQSLEDNPLLSKDIRFYFKPNSAELEWPNKDNEQHMADIKQLLQVSPGSTVLLRGHVDDALVSEFRKQGGEAFVRTQALRAMQLSKDRAAAVQKILVDQMKIASNRIETVGRGWEEPIESSANAPDESARAARSDKNRRVEVYWFTLE